MNTLKTKLLPWLIYPMTMGLSVALYLFLLQTKVNFLIATYVPLTVAMLSVTFFEYYTPYKKDWQATRLDVKHDMLFMVFIQLIFTKFLVFFTALILLRTVDNLNIHLKGIWPEHLPVIVQGIIMVLIIDFFRYWLHRASHNINYLWRLHAVHHSPKKLYWLNVGRFHPIERSLQFLIDSFPFMLLGVKEEALAMYFLFFSVNGFFQHCNIYLKYGILNYVVSSAELHRWHHSRRMEESNSNYSNTTIIWDVIFGTRYLPNNREVGELGLVNKNYPLGFADQMKTPFLSSIDKKELPVISFKDIFINWLLSIRMILLGWTLYRPFKNSAKNPWVHQQKLLLDIIYKNRDTRIGKKFNFNTIDTYDKFSKLLPVHSYEDLRLLIEEQEETKVPVLNSELPAMYNQTSGTTGLPKYIPIVKSTLEQIKRTQNIFSYIQYQTVSEGFYGKLLGLVSPAIEGHLPSGTPYGSASGLIYKNMPRIARSKYAVPYEVFEISDYDIKYYVIVAFALAEKNITYLGSANPSTFLRMLEVIKVYKKDLLNDIAIGSIRFIDKVKPEIASKITAAFKANPERAAELKSLTANSDELSFATLWPYLKIITTWTGGSCSIALNKIKAKLPPETKIFELGYLASEVRGTVTINNDNEGVLTFQDNFFEFVEKVKWENNIKDFLTINQIETQKEYYIFITTHSGLYRYDMNDIVRVTGMFENTPTVQFVQKGKGVVNITGEKLYENQVIIAMGKVEKEFELSPTFFQMIGDEEQIQYDLYLEADLNLADKEKIEASIDSYLCEINLEYKAKRSGGRLNPLRLHSLAKGTFEKYKVACLNKGQREGQFKTVALLLKRDISFPFHLHLE
jgi:sterol desaturase/sphingolipid hydroxylase (fatty acid hydroxylase superfamily)